MVQKPRQKKNPKQKKASRRVIFSNFNPGNNCDEDCTDKYNCGCDQFAIDAERMNLDIPTEGRILAIASVGRWNGRVRGYKILQPNVSAILYTECDYAAWYSDGHNIHSRQTHHDGTNLIEYREIREDRNINNLLQKLYSNEEVTRQQINYYTKSINPYVKNVYGW